MITENLALEYQARIANNLRDHIERTTGETYSCVSELVANAPSHFSYFPPNPEDPKVHTQTLERVLNGYDCKISTLANLCAFFECDLSELTKESNTQ